MNSVFAGAMISVMALCVFGVVIPLGGVTTELVFPAYCLAVLLMVLWAGSLLKEGTWTRSPMHLPVALFTVYATISYFVAAVEYEARLELFQVWACALVYFCCAFRFHRPVDRTAFVVTLLVLAVIESGYAIYQAATHADTVLMWERPPGYGTRASGTFIYPNQLSGILEVILGLAVTRLLMFRREALTIERSVLAKIFVAYALAMIVAGILVTRSRGGMIASATAVIAFLVWGDWRPRFWRIALVVLLLAAVAAFAFRFDAVRDRVMGSFRADQAGGKVSLADATLGGRTIMWKGTFRMIHDRPVFGTGPGSWQWVFQKYKQVVTWDLLSRPEYAHNDYLNLTADYGLVGLLLMGWLLFGFYRQALRLRQPDRPQEERAFAVGALISITSLLVHSSFDFVTHLPAMSLVVAMVLGMTAAMGPAPGVERPGLSWPVRCGLAVAILAVCAVGLWRFVPTARAARYTDLGNRLKKDLEYDIALSYYESARQQDPNSPEPYARIGDIYRTRALWRVGPDKEQDRRQYAATAKQFYDASLLINPYQSLVWSERGRVLQMSGDEAEAVRSYEEAIAAYPGNAYPYFLLGCIYRDRGDTNRAREYFYQADYITPAFTTGLNRYELEPPPTNPPTNAPPK